MEAWQWLDWVWQSALSLGGRGWRGWASWGEIGDVKVKVVNVNVKVSESYLNVKVHAYISLMTKVKRFNTIINIFIIIVIIGIFIKIIRIL